jgi:hypothetical protein
MSEMVSVPVATLRTLQAAAAEATTAREQAAEAAPRSNARAMVGQGQITALVAQDQCELTEAR